MTDRKTHYLAGMKLFGADRHAEAIEEYAKALTLSPDWTDALHALATSYSKLGRQDEAIATVQRIIELEPDDAFAYTSLSIFLQRKGQIPEAEAAAAKARMINWKQELKTNPKAPPPAPPGGMSVVQ
ncbi:MAG: tetratricopeptide repeat protein [Planctomycetota bacterium]